MTMNETSSSSSVKKSAADTTGISKGKAWVFGDNINTDIIIPFRFKSRTNDPYEMAKYAMYRFDPDFHKKISMNDIVSSIPLGRAGKPEEIAGVALILASDYTSFVNGQTIVVDGGGRSFYHKARSFYQLCMISCSLAPASLPT